jgi:hypothetical protein
VQSLDTLLAVFLSKGPLEALKSGTIVPGKIPDLFVKPLNVALADRNHRTQGRCLVECVPLCILAAQEVNQLAENMAQSSDFLEEDPSRLRCRRNSADILREDLGELYGEAQDSGNAGRKGEGIHSQPGFDFPESQLVRRLRIFSERVSMIEVYTRECGVSDHHHRIFVKRCSLLYLSNTQPIRDRHVAGIWPICTEG